MFLSVILPMSFLVTFKLSGLTGGPATLAETVVLEPAKWEFERPYYSLDFDDRVDSIYSSDIYMNNSVLVLGITSPESAFGGPLMGTRMILTASVGSGYVENVNVTFSDDYELSLINMYGLDGGGKEKDWAVWENLTATDYVYWVLGTEKAFVNLKGINRPQGVYFYIGQGWLLQTPNNQTQQLTMRVEVTYFNGTAHKKIVQPFQIRLFADEDNMFETAREVVANRTVSDWIGGGDRQDFFKIYLTSGDTLNATIPASDIYDVALYLYGPDDRNCPVAESSIGPLAEELISYRADVSDWWFLKVEAITNGGVYSLALLVYTE